MKQTVEQLRDGGWHGNDHRFNDPDPSNHPKRKIKAANCEGLHAKAIKMANDIFIPLCKDLGLSGTIGDLHVQEVEGLGTANFPTDLVVTEAANMVIIDDDGDDE